MVVVIPKEAYVAVSVCGACGSQMYWPLREGLSVFSVPVPKFCSQVLLFLVVISSKMQLLLFSIIRDLLSLTVSLTPHSVPTLMTDKEQGSHYPL